MKLKFLSLFILLIAFFPFEGQASSKLPTQVGLTEIHSSENLNRNKSSSEFPLGRRGNKTNNTIAFATRTGFVLLRKEEIISISVNKLYGGLMLNYWRMGKVKSVHCQSTLANAMERLVEFPFVKVSRSAIVNMDEVSEYVGTRRDAHLVLRDETMVKVSRSWAGELYEWFSKAASCESITKV